MPKKTAFLAATLTCLFTLCSIAVAIAGDVKLVSDQWDSVCRVEISWGPDAPDGAPVEEHLDVPRNWSITKVDRLCYRRASTPDNCDSGMTQWNTQWKCAEKAGTGTQELSLQ
jgi:hypothetical protein